MILYFCTQNANFGNSMVLNPRIPKSIDVDLNEDSVTTRICVAKTIKGAIDSIKNNIGFGCSLFVYSCEVNGNNIYEPTEKDVPDVKETGEIWLLSDMCFSLYKEVKNYNNMNELMREILKIG